ncbi:hypothetical protein [Actinoplanes sp. RD1]|uniref:hypothetical protein n=1 Tax=Actinoplanes sp. RD1 TaxID=3064538 RepID=UPI002742928A|nr:hypothetical protein [Actinoplanes sp. RD1]
MTLPSNGRHLVGLEDGLGAVIWRVRPACSSSPVWCSCVRSVAAGAQTIGPPACPHYQRRIPLHRRIDRQWLCRNCVAKSRARPCADCGALREPGSRDEHGRPMCPTCLLRQPANLETCTNCGRDRPVGVRTPAGPFCQTRPGFWRTCPGCGTPSRIHAGGNTRCARCTIRRRLAQLLGDDTGTIRPELQALHDALATTSRLSAVETWLNRSTGPTILQPSPDSP